jgi:hypothetical protein
MTSLGSIIIAHARIFIHRCKYKIERFLSSIEEDKEIVFTKNAHVLTGERKRYDETIPLSLMREKRI